MFCAENQIAAVFITADRQVYTTQQVGELCTFSFLGEEKRIYLMRSRMKWETP